MIKALAAGLPQLTIPLGRDQPNNAARVHAAGVGLRLKKNATPPRRSAQPCGACSTNPDSASEPNSWEPPSGPTPQATPRSPSWSTQHATATSSRRSGPHGAAVFDVADGGGGAALAIASLRGAMAAANSVS